MVKRCNRPLPAFQDVHQIGQDGYWCLDIYLRQNGDTLKPLHDQLHWTAPGMTKMRRLIGKFASELATAGAFSDGRNGRRGYHDGYKWASYT